MTGAPFTGKVAVVTGAGRGIGRAYAEGLGRRGAAVLAADIDEAGAQQTAQSVVAAGGESAAVAVDIADRDSVAAMADAATERFGGIDFLVNNAAIFGGMKLDFLLTVDWEYLQRFLEVNLLGALVCIRACYPSMAARGGGAIVNQSSTAAYLYAGYYGWAKAGVNSLTQQLAHELGGMNIRVNAIAPGPTDTEAARSVVPESYMADLVGSLALKRQGTPEDLVGMCMFLLSDDARWVTGHIFNVDGGQVMRPVTADASAPPASVVVVEDDADSAVRVVRFNRPEARNAFDASLYDAVTRAITDAAVATDVHVVVLTGTGSAFSAGQDLKEMARIVTGEATPEAARGFRGLLDAVGNFEKPLLAAVNGVGVGLGFTLLAHCDLVLMADDARLRVPFAELGVPPEAASSYLFPRTMGWQRAAHLLFTGAWMGARQAVDAGIALAHYPVESLLAETLSIAQVIAAAPLEAVMTSKRLLLATRSAEVVAARRHEDAAFVELLGSAANLAALERFGSDSGS